MPNIKSSTDLRNNYNEISSFCNETGEPIFITKNGRGDLAVMSIDLFNKFMGRYELYQLLEQSESDFTITLILLLVSIVTPENIVETFIT